MLQSAHKCCFLLCKHLIRPARCRRLARGALSSAMCRQHAPYGCSCKEEVRCNAMGTLCCASPWLPPLPPAAVPPLPPTTQLLPRCCRPPSVGLSGILGSFSAAAASPRSRLGAVGGVERWQREWRARHTRRRERLWPPGMLLIQICTCASPGACIRHRPDVVEASACCWLSALPVLPCWASLLLLVRSPGLMVHPSSCCCAGGGRRQQGRHPHLAAQQVPPHI